MEVLCSELAEDDHWVWGFDVDPGSFMIATEA